MACLHKDVVKSHLTGEEKGKGRKGGHSRSLPQSAQSVSFCWAVAFGGGIYSSKPSVDQLFRLFWSFGGPLFPGGKTHSHWSVDLEPSPVELRQKLFRRVCNRFHAIRPCSQTLFRPSIVFHPSRSSMEMAVMLVRCDACSSDPSIEIANSCSPEPKRPTNPQKVPLVQSLFFCLVTELFGRFEEIPPNNR